MQTVSAALQAELNKGPTEPRVLLDLIEFYPSDAIPGSAGFDPADAIETFAAQSITHNGVVYRRELVSRSDISRSMGEKTNNVTLTFSNISRYLATLAENQQIEGLLCIIRCVCPTVTDDSLVLFVGRLDKPSDIDKKKFSVNARQDFGDINQSAPPNEFSAQDPNGRLPSDLLYEGFNFLPVVGTNTNPRVEPSTSFLGRLFGRRRTTYYTEQWSSIDGTPLGQKIREVFGRCQVDLKPFVWADKGLYVTYLMYACRGPILAIENIKTRTEGFVNPAGENVPYNLPGPIGPVVHLGDPGGTGTNLGNTNQADLGGGSKFSHLAYIEGASDGSAPDATDDPPVVTALVVGRIVPLPDGSGIYVEEGWTDNPVHIARFILTDPGFVNINSGFMEDSVNYLTALHCDTPLIDETNGELIAIHQDDIADAGVNFNRYRSTGVLDARYMRYHHFAELDNPVLEDGPYEEYDPNNPVLPYIPGATPTFIRQRLLRKRYTCNFPITDDVRAVDLLYKTVFPAAKLFIRINGHGKTEIRSEQPADATRIRSSTSVSATSVPVLNVTPWKSGPDLLAGRIRVGQLGSITSEVRDVSSADYSTSGNSIPLAASDTGGVIATASGALLSGGSASTQASGTVTVGGTPGAGDTVTVTIDSIPVEYILDSNDTTGTVALMIKNWINATPGLQPHILASWDSGSPTVVTIKCLHGALNLSQALLKTHAGPVSNPPAPTVAAAASGSLDAGIYYLAYADVSNGGLTALTPVANVTLTADQKINVSSLPAFPAGVAERQFFLSEETGSENLRYHSTRTNVSDFSIDSLPESGSALPPSKNTTADELIRVAMSFATNSQDVYPAWPRSTVVVLDDIYLPTVLNGHKYQASSITTGLTAATEPTWPTTAGGTVVDGGVTWTEIGSTVLQQAGLTRANILKDSFNFPGGSKQSSVNQIKGSFRDAKGDFALTPFKVNDKAHQQQVKKVFPLEVDLSAVDNFHQVSRLANGLLSKHREGDWFNTLATGPQGLVLEEGDVICSSDDSGGLVNVTARIEELRIKPNHEVVITQARKYSTNMFSDDVGSHQITIPSTLHLSRPRMMTDDVVTKDASDHWLVKAIGHPRPSEEPESYEALFGLTADWTDEVANTVLTLPMVTGTSQAALLAGTTGEYGTSQEMRIAVTAVLSTGDASVVITAAGLTGSPITILVPVTMGQSASTVATNLLAALEADTDIDTFFLLQFTSSGTGVKLIKETGEADDPTMDFTATRFSFSLKHIHWGDTSTNHAYLNNAASFSLVGAGYVVTSIQAIEETYQRFDFEPTIDYADPSLAIGGEDFGEGYGVGLEIRADPGPILGAYPIPSSANVPLSFSWYIPADYYDSGDYAEGTVKEVWRSYGVELLTRNGIDPGRDPFTEAGGGTDHIAEYRKGPRYTFLVNGNEISAHKDYKVGGGHIVKVSLGEIPYPLRLSNWSMSTGAYLRAAMFGVGGSNAVSTILSKADQENPDTWGEVQTQLFIRLRQKSKLASIKGFPLDVVTP